MKTVLLCALLLVPCLFAQTNAGQITGTVTDQQTAALSGVKITATNLATNVQQSAVSQQCGAVFPAGARAGHLPPDCRTRPGFNRLIREPITVETAKRSAVDLQLTVGDTKVEVTVTGEAPLVQEANATVQYSINTKALDELPIANQSALQVLALVPGALGDPGYGAGRRHHRFRHSRRRHVGRRRPHGLHQLPGRRRQQQQPVLRPHLAFLLLRRGLRSRRQGQQLQRRVRARRRRHRHHDHPIRHQQLSRHAFSPSPRTTFSMPRHSTTPSTRKAWSATGAAASTSAARSGFPRSTTAGTAPSSSSITSRCGSYQQSSAFARVPTDAERQGDFSQSIYDTTTNQKVFIFQQYLANPSGTGWTNTRIVPAGRRRLSAIRQQHHPEAADLARSGRR